MRIVVRYLAQAQRAAGRAAEEVDAPAPCTAQELLRRLAGERPALGGLLLGPDGALRSSMLFFVGDEQIDGGEARPLRDGEALTVLAPMAGG
jgi:molybdopterin converting factor small subunit